MAGRRTNHPFPACRLADETATGDLVTGPGFPSVLIGGMPDSCMGDAVAGAACTGAVTMGSPSLLIGGRPANRVTSTVVGANPATGVPVTTAMAVGFPDVQFP